MRRFNRTCYGWQEIMDTPAESQDADIHTLLDFQEQHCNVECTAENLSSTTFIFKLDTNEVIFKRNTDSRNVNGLLCHLTIMSPQEIESHITYSLKIHCQVNETHMEFITPHSFAAFDDDELIPNTPNELVEYITSQQNQMTSAADIEEHVEVITPVQQQLLKLLETFQKNKKLIGASSVTQVAVDKIHHCFELRNLCPPLVTEIKSLIHEKKLDYNNILLSLTKHPSIPDSYEIAVGNHIFAAILEIKNDGKPTPKTLKCKIYEKTENFGILEIALNVKKTGTEHPLSYLEKVSVVRKTLQKNNICRDSVTKKKFAELRKFYNFLYPSDEMPRSLTFLISLPDDVFELCLKTSEKFTAGEIVHTSSKGPNFCHASYKLNSIKVLEPDAFWNNFGQSFRKNSTSATDILYKLSMSFGITDALKEFKATIGDFEQKLHRAGVKYSGNLEEAIAAFEMPIDVTDEEAVFLLSNRKIQKQLTRKSDFNVDIAKQNIQEFLKKVKESIKLEHQEFLIDLQVYQLIICFASLEWQTFDLPKNCTILDFYYFNDEQLGHEIPVAWKILVTTKGLQTPENGNLPLRSTQVRLFSISEGAEKDANFARTQVLQNKADEKSIKAGNIMDMQEIKNLFQFCEDQSACLIYEPPLEWIDLVISAAVSEIKECPKITVATNNKNIAARCKEVLSKSLTQQWKKVANETAPKPRPKTSTTPKTPRGTKRRANGSISLPSSPSVVPLPNESTQGSLTSP